MNDHPLVSSQTCVEVNWQAVLVVLNPQLWEATERWRLDARHYLMELFYWK